MKTESLSLLYKIERFLFHAFLSIRVYFIRKKRRIRFGFLLQELTQWKSEPLFKAMLAHPRFDPILCISPSIGYPNAENDLIKYCEEQNYKYFLLDPNKTIKKQIAVDIVTPEKPYITEMHRLHQVDHNKSIPFVVIPYYLSTITENWVVNQRINQLCWRQFIDNESCRLEWEKVHRAKGRNYVVTGLPVMDELLTPKNQLIDVWKNSDSKKRVIYAPHHTIADLHLEGIGYSTFLEYCRFMLELRDKYSDKVYFVFKPHPSLRNKLLEYWGAEETNAYYSQWDKPGFSQIEEGKYLSLFMYSDALIHDCGSFTVEYMYTTNPVLYLTKNDDHTKNMIPYAKEAFDLHYKGRCKNDIEEFIINVINENDPLKHNRVLFKEKYLFPPNGKTACENIIDAILEG